MFHTLFSRNIFRKITGEGWGGGMGVGGVSLISLRHVRVKKDLCNANIKSIEDKIPNISTLASNTTLNAKINEV